MTLGALGAVLATLVVVLVVLALIALAGTTLLVRRLRRPLLLVKGQNVPLRWRWSLARQAVLHRRLLVAVGQVRMTLPPGRDGPWQDLAADVERLAAGVDRELVEVDRRPRLLRQRALPPLEGRVKDVEQVAGRLAASLGSWEAPGAGRSAQEIMDRLRAIEGALAELQSPPPDLPGQVAEPPRRGGTDRPPPDAG